MEKPTGTYTVNKAQLFKQLGYTPMEHQWAYHNSDARFRCVCCGRRTGKTTMAGHDRVADLLKPKNLGWIVGPTYDMAAKEFRVMWESLIIGFGLGRDKRVKKNFNIKQGDMYIEMPWGSRVEVRSAAHPETLVGEGLNWVIMSEAAKQNEDTWQKYIRPALSDKRGTADFVTTPEGKNWFYKLWLLHKTQENYASWRFPSWVNTEVYPGGEKDDEIQLMRDTTLEEWFLQEIAAEFTAIVGRIFGEFAEEDHVLPKSYEFNPDWPNYIAFDWGFTAPLAAMEFQVSPRDEIFVWREHYVTNRTLEWHVNTLKEREQPPGYRLDGAFGDAADPEAVEYVSQHLVYCQADPDSKLWLPGIRQMKSFLKLSHDGISYDENAVPIMRPRYHVDPSCEEHIGELLGYKTKPGASANEFKGVGVVANGVADHSIDAMRYALMHLFSVGVQHHLDEVYPQWAKNSQRERIDVQMPAEGRIERNREPQKQPVGAAPSTGGGGKTFFSFNSGGPGGRF